MVCRDFWDSREQRDSLVGLLQLQMERLEWEMRQLKSRIMVIKPPYLQHKILYTLNLNHFNVP